MPIPNAKHAQVSPEKLKDYLLNTAHPIGGAKAKWFRSLGYGPNDLDRLTNDLLSIARKSSDYVEVTSDFGVKYVISGKLESANESGANVITVWIVELGEADPRFITAYPRDEK